MRIDKECTAMLLGREIAALENQCSQCAREARLLSDFRLEGMMGSSVDAAEQRVRMGAVVANAHLTFCKSLLQADRANLALVQRLPTTSKGVLDTAVAQRHIDDALRQRKALEWRREEAIAAAQWDRAQEAQQAAEEGWWVPPQEVDIDVVCYPFDRLIACQDEVIARNQRIIEQARRYERESSSLYGAVPTAMLDASTLSMKSYVNGDGWGSTQWIERSVFEGHVLDARLGGKSTQKADVWDQFIAGELVYKGSLLRSGDENTFDVAGVPGTYAVAGELAGGSVSLQPYGKSKRKLNEGTGESIALGAELEGEAYGARGTSKVGLAAADASVEMTLMGATASTVLGIGAGKGGSSGMDLAAKASAEASVLANEAKGSLGDDDYNYHVKAKGELLTASADAGVSFGTSGVEAKAGAEAYVATGEISGGVTLLGVKIDVALEAKAGGAGGAAGIGLDQSSLEGSLGVGLGLGLGAKVKVDWSGFMPAWKRSRELLAAWWNNRERRG